MIRPAQSAVATVAALLVVLASVACGGEEPTSAKAPSSTSGGAESVATAGSTVARALPTTDRLALRVSGKNFVDGHNRVVQLHGVNRPGTEYRCVQDIPHGFITDDGDLAGTRPSGAAKAVAAIRTWTGVNVVRIPLNEDCWLGINGAGGRTGAYAGKAYRTFIKAEVDALTRAGIYAILDLHWSASGRRLAIEQDVGPNVDHSVTFWSQVAKVFKGSPSVMFDLFNEPHVWCYTAACRADYSTAAATAWTMYKHGWPYRYSSGDFSDRTDGLYVAGTQQLVSEIRRVGARNVILVAGLGFANAMDNWAKFKPQDPLNQIAASFHSYPSSGATVNDEAALDRVLRSGGLSVKYPIFVGEFGDFCDTTDGFSLRTMQWADRHGYSYAAWGWDAGEGCGGPSLVTKNHGTPSSYGAVVKDHLAQYDD